MLSSFKGAKQRRLHDNHEGLQATHKTLVNCYGYLSDITLCLLKCRIHNELAYIYYFLFTFQVYFVVLSIIVQVITFSVHVRICLSFIFNYVICFFLSAFCSEFNSKRLLLCTNTNNYICFINHLPPLTLANHQILKLKCT